MFTDPEESTFHSVDVFEHLGPMEGVPFLRMRRETFSLSTSCHDAGTDVTALPSALAKSDLNSASLRSHKNSNLAMNTSPKAISRDSVEGTAEPVYSQSQAIFMAATTPEMPSDMANYDRDSSLQFPSHSLEDQTSLARINSDSTLVALADDEDEKEPAEEPHPCEQEEAPGTSPLLIEKKCPTKALPVTGGGATSTSSTSSLASVPTEPVTPLSFEKQHVKRPCSTPSLLASLISRSQREQQSMTPPAPSTERSPRPLRTARSWAAPDAQSPSQASDGSTATAQPQPHPMRGRGQAGHSSGNNPMRSAYMRFCQDMSSSFKKMLAW